MAPPSGPRAERGGAGGRGPRAGRGPRGGGIGKRRSDGPLKTDIDGDVKMDATTPGGRGARRGGRGSLAPSSDPRKSAQRSVRQSARLASNLQNYGASGSKAHLANTVKLKVSGVKESKAATNSDGGERSLVNFIERKCAKKMRVTINKSAMSGDFIFLNVSKDFAPEILKLNGFEHAGHPITIIETDEPWPVREREEHNKLSNNALEIKEILRTLAASRYNAEMKFLDLSRLGQDPILISSGALEDEKIALKTFKVLIAVASDSFKTSKERKNNVQLISLAANGLNSVSPIFMLADSFPDIIGLDLSNNEFASLDKIKPWKSHFRNITTICFAGNPIVANEPNLEKELMAWYPKLQNIDDKIVRTVADVALGYPVPIPQPAFDFRDIGGVGENFLREFFILYDTDRPQLVAKYYDEDSQFSLVAIPVSDVSSAEPALPWKKYMPVSHNLKRIGVRSGESQRRLFRGAQMIAELWKSLPDTKHPSVEETAKWVVDGHVLSGLADPAGGPDPVDGMIVTVHGEFEEVVEDGRKGRRAFCRHFTLGPAKPGRGAVRVISDQVTMRAWIPIGETMADPAVAPNLTIEQKKELVHDLSNRTGMTLEFSEMCLAGPKANWHFTLALSSFEELKSSLPPNAYTNGQPPAAA